MQSDRLASTLANPTLQALSYRCAFIIYLLILILGSIPGARQEIGEYAPGGVLHSLAYAGLTVLLFIGKGETIARRSIEAVLTVVVMGAIDEFVQSFLPYRGASAQDWLVDVVAAVITAIMLSKVYPKLAGMAKPS